MLAAHLIGCGMEYEHECVALSMMDKFVAERKFIRDKPAVVLRIFGAIQAGLSTDAAPFQ